MADGSNAQLVRAVQIAHDTEVRQSINGVRFATFGETGVEAVDLDHMLGAVPVSITAALGANTYYFVPLALRETEALAGGAGTVGSTRGQKNSDTAMVAPAYTDEFGDAAICHRNVELGAGHRGVFISTRLMSDRFALSFEFFINVAHAYVEAAGVPEAFNTLAWDQALANVKGETSFDAWEARQLAFGRPAELPPEPISKPANRRARAATAFVARPFTVTPAAAAPIAPEKINDEERQLFLETAFSDAIAIYLLSLALDFDYSELREREYPLLAPGALAARLRMVAELFPANTGYDFSIRYRRRA